MYTHHHYKNKQYSNHTLPLCTKSYQLSPVCLGCISLSDEHQRKRLFSSSYSTAGVHHLGQGIISELKAKAKEVIIREYYIAEHFTITMQLKEHEKNIRIKSQTSLEGHKIGPRNQTCRLFHIFKKTSTHLLAKYTDMCMCTDLGTQLGALRHNQVARYQTTYLDTSS